MGETLVKHDAKIPQQWTPCEAGLSSSTWIATQSLTHSLTHSLTAYMEHKENQVVLGPGLINGST